jgi:ubiquinone/menaquinone biosynthesis C-methylase UbiE
MEVTKTKPESVLEIGPGPGIVSEILNKMNVKVTTLDIDHRLKPNVCADATVLPFADKSFDTVLAAEILEHIPFNEVPKALKELSRVAGKSIVITLPHFSHFAPSIALKLFPYVPRFSKVFPVSLPVKHKFDGQHYWEIGKSGYSISAVRRLLTESTGMKLVKDYLIEENPFHHVFVLNRE